ncbi:MAG: metal-sulfur cluster assembly factor [Dehalococcoidia bacterium]
MITEEQVMDALRQVYDPELGLNIVDLGLVYGVDINDGQVQVTMTLTTPGCPLHNAIAGGAEAALRRLPGVESTAVQVVWDPRWTPERMSEAARQRLGWR